MSKLKTKAAKESLLRTVRKQRLRNITVLPSLITILNGLCGFAAITFASRAGDVVNEQFTYRKLEFSYFALSGYMILLAMAADMLDGRLARMSQSTSSFGGQLDSLCDIISFGVAPAFLMVKVLEARLAGMEDIGVTLEVMLKRFIWLAAAAYISCSAIRLARFNVENEEDESAHMSFMGLPTPAAAGVVVSLVIFHQEALVEFWSRDSGIFQWIDNVITAALPFISLGTAILMVSRIRYPHVLNQYLKGKKPLAYLMRILIFLGLFIWSRQLVLVLIFCGFATTGFFRWFYYKVLRRKSLSLSMEKSPLVAFDGADSAGREGGGG